MAHANGPSPDRQGSSDGGVGGPIRQDRSSHAQDLDEAIPSTAPSVAQGAKAAVTTVTSSSLVWFVAVFAKCCVAGEARGWCRCAGGKIGDGNARKEQARKDRGAGR